MGRPRKPGTAEERAQMRRDQVRANVRALRRRKKRDQEHQELQQQQQSAGVPVRLNADENTVTGAIDTVHGYTRSSGSPSHSAASLQLQCEKQQVRLSHELDGSSLRWRLQFPFRICPGSGPAYRDAFIAAFSDATDMPDHATLEDVGRIHINVCCGTWVSSACIERDEPRNSLLSDALLATALAFFGSVTHDTAMIAAAVETESAVVSRLRLCLKQDFSNARSEREHRLSTTVLALALANLLIHKSWLSFALHLSGVAGLIQAAGPEMLVTPAAIDNFCGYRAVQLPFSFMERKAAFCSQRKWIDFPGRANSENACSNLHRFVDIAYEIPALMQKFDDAWLRNRQEASSLYPFLARAWKIGAALDMWETKSGLSFPWASSVSASLPNERMKFDDTLTANAGAMVLGARVGLFHLILEMETHLSPADDEDEAARQLQLSIEQMQLWSARAIQCASFFRDIEPRTVGKLVCLFPLDMAWRALCDLHDTYGVDCVNDIERCRMLAIAFESNGLPALRTHWSRSAA